MKNTLLQQPGRVGDYVYCLEDCKDENGDRSYKKGSRYQISNWYSDECSTFGSTHSQYITKKKYFSLIAPTINYEIY